jgi:hypothetical protein
LAQNGAMRTVVWSSEQGRVEFSERAPGLYLIFLSGYLEVDAAHALHRQLTPLFARGTAVRLFYDAEALESYDPKFRIVMGNMHKEWLPQLAELHGLVRSRIVAMGAAVVNITLGGKLQVVNSRAKFEQALAAARAR